MTIAQDSGRRGTEIGSGSAGSQQDLAAAESLPIYTVFHSGLLGTFGENRQFSHGDCGSVVKIGRSRRFPARRDVMPFRAE